MRSEAPAPTLALMTRTATPRRGDLRVLIAGAGVAGLEAALALRELAGERVEVELLSAEPYFFYRPLSVVEPFRPGSVPRREIGALARAAGAVVTLGELVSLDAGSHVARLTSGSELPYDAIVLTFGALPRPAVPGAVSFRGPADVDRVRDVLAEIDRGEVRRLVFAVPSGVVWPLPLYELALLFSAELERKDVPAELTLVTSEPAPLALFGGPASGAVAALLRERGVRVLTSAYAQNVTPEGLVLDPRHGFVAADRVLALPRLAAPEIEGVPRDRSGFVPTDPHGRVPGLPDVYAAGDLTSFPIKQGGLAAQQADAAAEAIVAPLVGREPRPFRPVLRALLLTGGRRAYLQVAPTGGSGETSTAAEEPLWRPAGKIAGKYLAPFLAELGVIDDVEEADDLDQPLRVELDASFGALEPALD